ncbi:hypothetical protein AAHA92_00564 [Salvia divinorum]|uniref:Uncharacterized protein n=1 Tax=Salvia divinorum TaxID=28513 RepID=A0ABD1IJZ9_SALDI
MWRSASFRSGVRTCTSFSFPNFLSLRDSRRGVRPPVPPATSPPGPSHITLTLPPISALLTARLGASLHFDGQRLRGRRLSPLQSNHIRPRSERK